MEDYAAKGNQAQIEKLAARWSLGSEGKSPIEEQDIIYLQLPCALLQGQVILLPLILQPTTPLPPTRR